MSLLAENQAEEIYAAGCHILRDMIPGEEERVKDGEVTGEAANCI